MRPSAKPEAARWTETETISIDYVVHWDGMPDIDDIGGWPFSTRWLGVSVENQATADERVPIN